MSTERQRVERGRVDVPVGGTTSAAGGGGWGRKIAVHALIALIAFMLGFFPMWMRARDAAANLDTTQRELRLSQVKNALGAATVDARRGEYEVARQSASDFFTRLRAEMDRKDALTFTAGQRTNLETVLAERDEVITLLARSDPAAADRLTKTYVTYNQALGGG